MKNFVCYLTFCFFCLRNLLDIVWKMCTRLGTNSKSPCFQSSAPAARPPASVPGILLHPLFPQNLSKSHLLEKSICQRKGMWITISYYYMLQINQSHVGERKSWVLLLLPENRTSSLNVLIQTETLLTETPSCDTTCIILSLIAMLYLLFAHICS